MARKANKNTSNVELVADILSDQSDFMLTHKKSGNVRVERIEHNLVELFRRLGEEIPENTHLYYFG